MIRVRRLIQHGLGVSLDAMMAAFVLMTLAWLSGAHLLARVLGLVGAACFAAAMTGLVIQELTGSDSPDDPA